MFVVGMQMAETGAALDLMTRRLALTPSQQGLLVSVRFVGGLVVGLALWLSHARIRFRPALAASLVLVVISGPMLARPSFATAMTIAALRGVSMGAVIPLSGMYAAAQRRWKPGQVAAAVNATLSAGMVVLSLFAFFLSATAAAEWQTYWAPAAVLAALLLLGLPWIGFPRAAGDEASEPTHGRGNVGSRGSGGRLGSVVRRTTWAYAAAGLLLVGSEGTLLGLFPAQTVVLADTGFGGELLALLTMSGVLVGRAAGTRLFALFSTVQVLSGSVGAFVAAAVAWSLVPAAAPLVLFLLGFSTANLFPGMISYISHERPQSAGATIAAIGWSGGLGGTLVPALAGAGLGVGLPLPWLSAFLILPTLGAYLLARTIDPR